jgi:hypothetical protein
MVIGPHGLRLTHTARWRDGLRIDTNRGAARGRGSADRGGLRAREEELDQLRAAKRDEIGGRLRDARGYGEPGGNDEYLATREDEAIIDARIAALEAMLAKASVVQHGGGPGSSGSGRS